MPEKIAAKDLRVGDALLAPSVPPAKWEVLAIDPNPHKNPGAVVTVRVSLPKCPEASQVQMRYVPEEGLPKWQDPEPDRKEILLRAAYDVLRRESQGLRMAAQYDGTECDADCLLEDIEVELGLSENADPIPFES